MEYPNGDRAQSICIVFGLNVMGGELFCDGEETMELRYFPLDNTPEMFCKQHADILCDIKKK